MKIRLIKTEEQKKRLTKGLRIMRFAGQADKREGRIVEVNLARLFVLLSVVAVALYIGTGIGLYAWRNKVPYNQITLANILLPTQWAQLSEKQGLTKIKHGLALHEEGNNRQAINPLRSGLIRYPHHFEARLALAKIYSKSRFLEESTRILEEGLTYGYPSDPEYTKQFARIALFRENYDVIVSYFKKLLSYEESKKDRETFSGYQKVYVSALLAKKDFETLYDVSHALNNDPEAKQKAYDAEFASLVFLKRFEEAKALLDSLPDALKAVASYDLLLIKYYSSLDDPDNMVKAYASLEKKYYKDWEKQAQALVLILKTSEAHADPLLKAYFEQHRFNDDALLSIASLLTDVPSSKYLRLCREKAQKFATSKTVPLNFYLVQSLISEGHWEEAAQEFEIWKNLKDNDKESNAHYTEWMEVLLQAVTINGNAQLVALNEIVRARVFEQEVYIETALALQKVASYEMANTILDFALEIYPFNKPLIKIRKELNTAIDLEERDKSEALKAKAASVTRESSDEVEAAVQNRINEINQ